MKTSKHFQAFLLLAALSLVSFAVRAEVSQSERLKAEALLAQGQTVLAAADAEHAELAFPLLQEAHRLLHEPRTGYQLMQAYLGRSKLVEARAIGEEFQDQQGNPNESKENAEARERIKEAILGLDREIPKITLKIGEASRDCIQVKIDGHLLTLDRLDEPYRVNVGDHEIVATTKTGYQPTTQSKSIVIAEAREYPVQIDVGSCHTLKLSNVSVSPGSPPKPSELAGKVKVAWVAGGVLAGIAIGTGIGAAVTYVPMKDAWYENGCSAQCRLQYESRQTLLEGLSITAAVAGTLGLATLGYALYGTFTNGKKQVGVHVMPMANGGMLVGTW